MLPRSLMLPTLLAASVSIPYLASNSPEWMKSWRQVAGKPVPANSAALPAGMGGAASGRGAMPLASSPGLLSPAVPQGPGSTLYPTTTPLEGTPSVSLAEVLRLDVTKEWVYQRWARKSTGLADLKHFGIRVPLVTGTKLSDLAGSLTYFFGADGRVERISFRGSTGDTTQLVMLLVRQYQLQRQSTTFPGEQLFQVRRGDKVFSELRTRPAAVLWSSSPHNSFSVELELQRPDAQTPLPGKPPLVAELGLPQSPLPQSPQTQQPPQPQPPQSQPTDAAGADPPQSEKAEDGHEKWNALFPRSRLPKEQIENLEQRRRNW